MNSTFKPGCPVHALQVKSEGRFPLVKRLVVLSLAAALLSFAGLGCNTAHGFGKDMENAGEGIQKGTK